MDEYRTEVGLSLKQDWDDQVMQKVESWPFGKGAPEGTSAAFQDYLLLQTLSSRLRSALAEDIASSCRHRP